MRQLIVDVRAEDGESPESVDNAGLGEALQRVVGAWAGGRQSPGIDAHVEKTKVVDTDGNWVGFNYYLVAGEPRFLGVRTEKDG